MVSVSKYSKFMGIGVVVNLADFGLEVLNLEMKVSEVILLLRCGGGAPYKDTPMV